VNNSFKMQNSQYDTAIIGGGLAGLSLSILLAKQNHSVLLIEKETYPFHKVCGEYISLESWDFLSKEIGVPLQDLNLPIIKKLMVTAPNGNTLHSNLDLGGFGISRYTLDNILQQIAKQHGVTILEACKAENIILENDIFTITTNKGNFTSNLCCGSWGKRSNVDIKWKRSFTTKTSDKLNNFIGVKYHVKTDFPNDVIALHNFKDGYCGISQIEDGKHCICYLTKASNLKKAGSIEKMEAEILSENPYLKKLFATATKLYDAPVTISQISFSKKNCIENNVLMLGDAGGMITPLCGNGMSIAMHTAKITSKIVNDYLQNKITRAALENNYTKTWNENFATRIKIGKAVQYLFGRKTTTNIFIAIMKMSKGLTNTLIKSTHGKGF
jgi:menaquinone-9 beta-reductase